VRHSMSEAPATLDSSTVSLQLPRSVCFRVTRLCNARCGFCLAPPTADRPDGRTLIHRLDWLFAHGVRSYHFCGGEPTIHPALQELLLHVSQLGGKSKLTTNGIAVSPLLPAVLRATPPPGRGRAVTGATAKGHSAHRRLR